MALCIKNALVRGACINSRKKLVESSSKRRIYVQFSSSSHPFVHKSVLFRLSSIIAREGSTTASDATLTRQGKARTENADGELSDDEGHLIKVYREMVTKSSGQFHEDQHQIRALVSLNRLFEELQQLDGKHIEKDSSKYSPSFWSSLGFGGGTGTGNDNFEKGSLESSVVGQLGALGSSSSSVPRGIYLHGGVGCGKTFVMSLFYDQVNFNDESGKKATTKQKTHFHKFMLRIHAEMHQSRKTTSGDEAFDKVVQSILAKGQLICLDEFQVTDVADAMILKRLWTALIERGAILVATSNRPPQDLYMNGLQRDLFVPFIDFLEEHCDVVDMSESDVDYRLLQPKSENGAGVYFVGKERKIRKEFDDLFHRLVDGSTVKATQLAVGSRFVSIPRASSKGVARFQFEDLCCKALGAEDYLMIAHSFHTVFVENVPQMKLNQINWVRRFIILVDAMYEAHVKLVIHAASPPEGIYQVNLRSNIDESFSFDRTRSRLEEMQSSTYLKKKWVREGEQKQESRLKPKVHLEPSLSENMVR